MNIAHVYIYGVIDSWQDQGSSDWGYVNLKDVKNQLDSQKDAEEILVHINSPGGHVTEGFAIHDFLRAQGKPVTTQIEGMCYSIATVIALAGDVRKMTSNAEFMIHNPWGGIQGDKEELRKYADQLENIENNVADFYASKTNINATRALELMKEETFMNVETATELGFITEELVTMKAVALYNLKTKNKDDMNLKETVNKMIGKKASLKLTTATGTMLNIETEADVAAVGDTVSQEDGKTLENGDVLLQNGETLVIENGEIAEIKEKEDPQNARIENLEAQLKALTDQLAAQDSKFDAQSNAVNLLAEELDKSEKKFTELAKNVKSAEFKAPAAPQTDKTTKEAELSIYDKIQAQKAEKENK